MFTSTDPRIVSLLEHRKATRVTGGGQGLLGASADVDNLLRSDSMAMLTGLVLQRGMPAERVWQIPMHLRSKLGHLDPARIAHMSVRDMTITFDSLEVRPRYPAQAAKTVVALAQLVTNAFGGDGSSVWHGRAMRDVIATLQSLPWVGPGIAHMAVQILMDEAGYEPHADELPSLDVKADVHVVRVFYRLGIAADETRDAALDAARRLHPRFPGLLDWPAWDIGRRVCRPQSPACGECPVSEFCERRGVGDTQEGARALDETRSTAVTVSQVVADDQSRTVSDPDGDFWLLLARLLEVAMQSADHGGVAHRFASVAPLLITNPDLARARCQVLATELLTARLPSSRSIGPVDVVALAVSAGIIDASQADTLRKCFAHMPTKVRTADAVTQILQTVLALGR